MKISDLFYSIVTGPRRRRRLLTPVGFILFFGYLFLIIFGSLYLDRMFGLPPLLKGVPGVLVGTILSATGLFFAGWCVLLFKRAQGTPLPINPPDELVTDGPYAYSRNPMVTGVFGVLFGIGFLLHSVSLVVILAPLNLTLLIIELKFVEEPKLERRFGERYREYRRRVPMFFPGIHGGEK